jgi:hypothetical protein
VTLDSNLFTRAGNDAVQGEQTDETLTFQYDEIKSAS